MNGERDLRLASGWMLAVVPDGLAIVGPETETTIDLEGGATAGLALATAAPLGDREGRKRLLDLLEQQGALGDAAPVAGIPLTSAIESVRRGEPCPGTIVTADEALILPESLSPELQHRTIRSFVAGLLPEGRLRGYALLATGKGPRGVFGDLPAPALLLGRTQGPAPEGLAPEDPPVGGYSEDPPVSAIELQSGRRWDVAPADLDRIGASEAHRLGPIRISRKPTPLDPGDPDGLQVCTAQIPMPDLSLRSDPLRRTVQGVGTADVACLIAHAEGAERFCGAQTPDGSPGPDDSRVSDGSLIRSRFQDLPAAVDPGLVYASRSFPADMGEHGDERLWAPAVTRDGARRWVPAETVFPSLEAPAPRRARLPVGSSGLAADLSPEAAGARAFCELVERDAFMWTWMRRVSRERVASTGIPEESARLRDLALANGWETHWVNLSLETFPVILCCLTHPEKGLTLGAGCKADPAVALHRATVEAAVLALRFEPGGERISADEVRDPRDHLLYHLDPGRRAEHGFLFSSSEEIGLDEIPSGDEGIEDELEEAGFQPMSVDLSIETCRPYRVVRALAPGLIPIAFGFGREPDAMARAGTGLRTRDGRLVGDGPVTGAEPGVPHPFA